LKEIHERQYRKDQRALQSQNEEEHEYQPDDSEKFLKKMREKEEKIAKAHLKNDIYAQEMAKCMPKARGKAK